MSNPTSSFRIRPCFEHTVHATPDEIRDQLLKAFRAHGAAFEVKAFPGFIGLHICEDDRHRWSPRLHLGLEAAPSGGTRISGVYGPEHEVWALFIYGYLISGLLGLFSAILGFAQWFLGQLAWGLWIAGSMAVVACLLYLFAQMGQKLGAWQTFQLHQAYQHAIAGASPAEDSRA